MSLDIVTIPCLSDNYIYLLHDGASGVTALVDAPVSDPVLEALASHRWGLDLILLTHHHEDHIAAADDLRRATGAKLVGAKADAHRLPALDIAVEEGDTVAVGSQTGHVLSVPGHTTGHIAYYFPASKAAFTADSLMVMGCGRLFEGDAIMMWDSLRKLAALPDDTLIYSGHEYTNGNIAFALSLDPDNAELRQRADDAHAARTAHEPTVPAELGLERRTNPFLRAGEAAMKQAVGMPGASDVDVFAEIRARKDRF
jgi:hydroxyacylglutathione hydrolase